MLLYASAELYNGGELTIVVEHFLFQITRRIPSWSLSILWCDTFI
jgi:hypothetical protein